MPTQPTPKAIRNNRHRVFQSIGMAACTPSVPGPAAITSQRKKQPAAMTASATPQSRAMRLNFESQAVRGYQIQRHQAADGETAREIKTAADVLPGGKPGGREEDLEIDPGQRAAEIIVQDPPDVVACLGERAGEHEEDGQAEQRDRELEGRERREKR